MAKFRGLLHAFALAAALAAAPPGPAMAATISTVALSGQAAPGAGGATYAFFAEPALNNAGETAFLAFLTGDGVTSANDQGIFTSASLVARKGDMAPGAGAPFGDFRSLPVLNKSGETAFVAAIASAAPGDQGLFKGSGLVARRGGPAPDGSVWRAFGRVALGDSGTVVFTAQTRDTGSAGSLFTETASIAEANGQVPVIEGAEYVSLRNSFPSVNASDQVAFVTRLRVPGDADEAIFRTTDATVDTIVARRLDPAPGLDGVTLNFLGAPSINDAGDVAFQASLAGAGVTPGVNSLAVFGPGGLVARGGDVAPGTGGATFTGVGFPTLNAAGSIAFAALLSDMTTGLFVADAAGPIRLIQQTGDTIDVGGGDLRTVEFLNFLSDGGFNDRGDVAFQARFTDGSEGIFLWLAESAGAPFPPGLAIAPGLQPGGTPPGFGIAPGLARKPGGRPPGLAKRSSAQVVPTPLPPGLALALAGMAGLALVARRRRA